MLTKKSLIVVLIAALVMLFATTVNAGSSVDELVNYLTTPHTICGKTYEASNFYKEACIDYLRVTGKVTDEQASQALSYLKSAEAKLNETGAQKLSDVPHDVQAQVISILTQAGAAVNLDVLINTQTNYVTVINKADNSLVMSMGYTTDAEGNLSINTGTRKLSTVEGENQLYNVDSAVELTFRFPADYSLFKDGGKVYMDGTLVEPSNYTSRSGSTIISFKYEYARNLALGDHTVRVVFNNGTEASASFKAINSTGAAPVGGGSAPTTATGGKFVYTGSNNTIYVVLLAVAIVSTAFVVKKVYVNK